MSDNTLQTQLSRLSASASTDRYPSRQSPEPSITDRLDPVVYGSAAGGPLTESQLRYFEDHGYLSMDELFSEAELGSYMLELQRLRSDEQAKERAGGGDRAREP